MKSYVMFGILLALLNKKRCTLKQLAEEFEVSTKTISRHIANLEISGVPIISYAGKGGGIELANTFALDNAFFSQEEQNTLLYLLKSNEILIDKDLNSTITEKLESITPHDYSSQKLDKAPNIFVDMLPWYENIKPDKRCNDLKKCCFENRTLEIEYEKLDGEKNIRRIEPHLVIYKENSFYLYAYCEEKQDFRLFKISRIKNYRRLDTTFTRKSIDYNSTPWNKSNFQNIDITIQYFNDSILPECADWLGEYRLDERNKLIKTTKPYNQWLLTKLISYENNLKVISPSFLIDNIKQYCDKIRNLYV